LNLTFSIYLFWSVEDKDKAISIEVVWFVRSPDFEKSANEAGKVSPTHRPPLPPRKYSRYSFQLQAMSTPVT